MSPEKQRRIFISYSRIDKEFAFKLAFELKSSGFSVWFDQLDIPTGSRWDDEVEQALRDCEIFMVILTPASSASDNVKDEISYAVDTDKRILPILLKNAIIPLRLRRFQYVDFTAKDYDEGVESAKKLLRRLIEGKTTPRDLFLGKAKTQKSDVDHKVKEEKLAPSPEPSSILNRNIRIPLIISAVGLGGVVLGVAVIMLVNKFSGEVTPTAPTEEKSPTATELPVTQTPESIHVTGPSMEVGSLHPYVDGSNLLAVPAGDFIMGADGDDNPEHLVTLDDFWIYSTEVTNQQYTFCVEMGECTKPDLLDNPAYLYSIHANDPVVGVTYEQAMTYCEFVNGRLPTEAEWEKTARGPDGNIYPWGDETPSCDELNFDNCTGEVTNVINYPDSKSYYGGLDTAGNVFEWVADWYDAAYYSSSPEENPHGPENGTSRSVRSSSFESNADQAILTVRNSENPQNHRPDIGFRCVVDSPTYFAPICEVPIMYSSGTDSTSLQELDSSSSCPELEISQAKYCVNKIPATNIKFKGPSSSIINAADCTSTDDPALFVCQSPRTTVSITAECQVDVSGDIICPPGYSLDDNSCETNGAQGECLGGYTFDDARQCCVQNTDQEESFTVSVCPVGTYYVSGQNACVPIAVQNVVSVVQTVELTTCSSGDGGGSGGSGGGSILCTTDGDCPQGYSCVDGICQKN